MSINIKKAVLLSLIVPFSANVHAGPKEDQLLRLNELSISIDQLKANGDSPALQDAMNEYLSASNSLGGDQAPSSFAGGSLSGTTRSAPAGPADTITTTANFSSAPGAAITTGTPVQETIAVTTTDTYLWDVDLNVNITHTFSSDLDFTLTSPAGTTVVVSTDNGGGNDNVFAGTLFDDDAVPNTITDFTFANLTVATPLTLEGALGAMIGEDPNGTWTLDIVDDAGGDDGTLVDWSLDITTLDQIPINDAPVTGTSSPAAAITTGTPVQDTIMLTAPNGFLCDLNMTTDITHTFASDLDFTLTSPAGTVVTISTDNGGGNDNIFSGTVWDDSALSPVTDFTHANLVTSTPLVPEANLAAFIGEDPNGAWALDIVDDAGGDDGTLNSWSLDVTTCAGVPPVVDADLSVALTSNAVEPVGVGDQFELTTTVTNNGPADATNVVATTTLPNGVIFVSSACSTAVGNLVTFTVGNLANGAVSACDATVQANITGGLSFTATVTGDENDPTPANNASAPLVLGGAAVSVPSLSTWGMLLMLLGITGMVLVQNKRNRQF